MDVQFGPVIVTGYTVGQDIPDALQEILDALQNVVYRSDQYNTSNHGMRKVTLTVEVE